MEIQLEEGFSKCLNRTMSYKVFGHGGQLCFGFPPQNGRFYDLENFGIVDSLAPWLESGQLQLVCVDGVDAETWSNQDGDPRKRIELQERWYHYVVDELYPLMQKRNGSKRKAFAMGCSMGGMHAGIFFFRRPDLFGSMLSLSGLFDADYFFHGYMDDLVYDNSPIHFLRNMPADHPYMELYRHSNIILCVGQGAWEDDLLASTRAMDDLLHEKRIPAWADYWGYDVNHDWCWWKKQAPYFMEKLLALR